MRKRTAVLVVDVQRSAVALEPWRCDEVLENMVRVVEAARRGGADVVHVQHDGRADEGCEPGSEGWEIHPAVAPTPGEKVVRKRFNSAFRGTDLHAHLEGRGVGTLVLMGIQTEYCVDTTCRVAFELGYGVIMPEMTNTTYDSGGLTARQIHEHHNRRIFAGRFAAVPPLAEALVALEGVGGG